MTTTTAELVTEETFSAERSAEVAALAERIDAGAEVLAPEVGAEQTAGDAGAYYELHLPGGGHVRVGGNFQYRHVHRLLGLLRAHLSDAGSAEAQGELLARSAERIAGVEAGSAELTSAELTSPERATAEATTAEATTAEAPTPPAA